MEIINVEVYITKNYVFSKNNIDYSCLVQIKNNQITDISITTNNGLEPDFESVNEIKNLISV